MRWRDRERKKSGRKKWKEKINGEGLIEEEREKGRYSDRMMEKRNKEKKRQDVMRVLLISPSLTPTHTHTYTVISFLKAVM